MNNDVDKMIAGRVVTTPIIIECKTQLGQRPVFGGPEGSIDDIADRQLPHPDAAVFGNGFYIIKYKWSVNGVDIN